MTWIFECGHTREISPYTSFFTMLHEGCMRCLMEAKATKKSDKGE